MSRSRSYERSRHHELSKRPLEGMIQILSSFSDDGDKNDSVVDTKFDPTFPIPGRALRFYLTPRHYEDLPRFAYQEAA